MKSTWPIVISLFLSSCGAYQWLGDKSVKNSREIASVGARQLLSQDRVSFSEMLDEKLNSLYSYYLIGQKNLEKFDSQINEIPLSKIYESDPYLNLMAVRTQVEEIEDELEQVWSEVKNSKNKGHSILKFNMQNKIQKFSESSPYASLAMENLKYLLELKSENGKAKNKIKLNHESLQIELKSMDSSKEFIVYEKNIEHISHMLNIKYDGEAKKFYPSSGKQGNIVGNEFPSKVWSLTFDDGPGELTTPKILKALKQRKLKATFFQLTKQVNSLPAISNQLREAGMEIASHSYTHKQLTKIGAISLEKEITQAVSELKKFHGIDIKFYRLPYGAGVNSTHIRDKIAENKLIHVFWNIDTLDWMPQGPSKIVARTLGLMKKTPKDAGVVLFHDIHERTTKASLKIMDYLKKDGRRVCTLDEIVTQMNEGVKTVCP